jgi:hypothetical protein
MNLQESPRSVVSPPPLPFACDLASVRAVRRYVRDRAIAGGRSDLADEAESVAGELFANAVQAQTRQRVTTVISVQAVVHGYALAVEVYDHAQGGPFLHDLSRDWLTAERGRGMHMVHRITQGAWKWDPWATGKVVTATITDPLP